MALVLLRQQLPSLHNRVRVERDRRNALLYQPLGKVGVVAGALAADAYVFALIQTGFDGHGEHGFDGGVAFVEVFGQELQSRVAVQAQGELGEVVGTDGEAVVVLQELCGEDGVAGYFAHHDVA
jgi:hypothetical protein